MSSFSYRPEWAGSHPIQHETEASSPPPRAWAYFTRGCRWRCPECGVSPVFKPARTVRSLRDWFDTLEGCPRCNYKYDREHGYFLLAIWGVNYGVVGSLALAMTFLIDAYYPLKMWEYVTLVLVTLPVLSFLFARHSKSLFLAMDHYFDPQARPTAEDAKAAKQNRNI